MGIYIHSMSSNESNKKSHFIDEQMPELSLERWSINKNEQTPQQIVTSNAKRSAM